MSCTSPEPPGPIPSYQAGRHRLRGFVGEINLLQEIKTYLRDMQLAILRNSVAGRTVVTHRARKLKRDRVSVFLLYVLQSATSCV